MQNATGTVVDMRLTSINTYPVKGLHRVEQDSARVEPWGLAGDRRFLLVDRDGVMLTQRQEPRLTQLQPSYVDGELVVTATGPTSWCRARPRGRRTAGWAGGSGSARSPSGCRSCAAVASCRRQTRRRGYAAGSRRAPSPATAPSTSRCCSAST